MCIHVHARFVCLSAPPTSGLIIPKLAIQIALEALWSPFTYTCFALSTRVMLSMWFAPSTHFALSMCFVLSTLFVLSTHTKSVPCQDHDWIT